MDLIVTVLVPDAFKISLNHSFRNIKGYLNTLSRISIIFSTNFKTVFSYSYSMNKPLSQTHAKRVLNRSKNRCFYSLPFDHNRVQLQRRSATQTDYINASFVDGYIRRKAYICAQSPFNAATASDFWAMVYQCNVAQIVTLDNLIEGGVVKCTKFWPEVGFFSIPIFKSLVFIIYFYLSRT